jgi:hypothetical protein
MSGIGGTPDTELRWPELGVDRPVPLKVRLAEVQDIAVEAPSTIVPLQDVRAAEKPGPGFLAERAQLRHPDGDRGVLFSSAGPPRDQKRELVMTKRTIETGREASEHRESLRRRHGESARSIAQEWGVAHTTVAGAGPLGPSPGVLASRYRLSNACRPRSRYQRGRSGWQLCRRHGSTMTEITKATQCLRERDDHIGWALTAP